MSKYMPFHFHIDAGPQFTTATTTIGSKFTSFNSIVCYGGNHTLLTKLAWRRLSSRYS